MLASAVALAGIAVSNILLPVLVKRYFPHRLGMVTGFYTVAMIAGSTASAASSVPVANLAGTWRVGLGGWALFAALAMVPIVLLRRRLVPASAEGSNHGPIRPSRTRLGWTMAVLFGMQSFSGYAIMGWLPHVFRDAGYSSQTSGLLLALLIGAGLPFALVMPTIAARWTDQRVLVLVLASTMLVAYLGLALAPGSAALLWIGLLAIGQSVFPLTLVLIGMRARTHAGTVALSAFTQSIGYLIAAAGPLSVGLLYEATGGWIASFGVLVGALVIQAVAGVRVARPRTIEDELAQRQAVTSAASNRTVVAEVTDVVGLNTRGDGSCLTPVRAKAANPGSVGAKPGLAEKVARRRPHAPRTRWNIGRHESPRPGGRR
jgi:CP family cyanate transporter-like MFS transporter